MKEYTFHVRSSGSLALTSNRNASEFCIHVTGVPSEKKPKDVLAKLNRITWLPIAGPWYVGWRKIDDAKPGALLRLR